MKYKKMIKIDSDDVQIIEKNEALYSAFQSIATLKNIKSCFEAAGAVYEASHSVIPISPRIFYQIQKARRKRKSYQ